MGNLVVLVSLDIVQDKDLSEHPWIVNPAGCGGGELLRGTLSGSRLPF
jgi:hypothetical protein